MERTLNALFPIPPWIGFRVRPEDDVPGFRVAPEAAIPGFNLGDNGVSPQAAIAPGGGMPFPSRPPYAGLTGRPVSQILRTQPPDTSDFVEPDRQDFPDWLNDLLTMPLPKGPNAIDPRTGQPIVRYAPPINVPTSPAPADRYAPPAEDARFDMLGPSNPPPGGLPELLPGADKRSFESAARPGPLSTPFDPVGRQDVNPRYPADRPMTSALPAYAWPRVQLPNNKSEDSDPIEFVPQATDGPPTPSATRPAGYNLAVPNGIDASQAQWPPAQDAAEQQKTSAFSPAPALNSKPRAPSMPSLGLTADGQSPSFQASGNTFPIDESPAASPLERSVYKPDTDGKYDDLFQLIQDVKENREKSKTAERAHKEAIITEHDGAILVEQIQLHAPGMQTYSVADLVWRKNGTAAIVITEVKTGDGTLSPQQLDALGEAARNGNVYIKNERAAERLGIKPWVTFADQHKQPEVFVSGGNPEAVIKQLRNKGLEATPVLGPGGRPALQIIRAGRGGRAF